MGILAWIVLGALAGWIASIIMKKNGDITIQGKNIKIIGSGKIDMKASGNMTLKGSQIKEN